jgi:fructosamine-3-kinase
MFTSEAAGLRLLADSQTVAIPKVITQGQWNDLTYLLMEWIDTAEPAPSGTMELFGRQLAGMHRHSACSPR